MTVPPTVTYHLDPATYDVLTDALEQHAAHLEQVTHESLFAPTAADREELHAEAARAEQLRDAIDREFFLLSEAHYQRYIAPSFLRDALGQG